MVELTASRGVEAIVGDVADMPFRDESFDCAVAAWMLYHAPDLDRALAELRRVLRSSGRLVAATSSERNLAEVFELVGEIGAPAGAFSAENAESSLRRHFRSVERRDLFDTVTFNGREVLYEYLAATRSAEVAERLPDIAAPLLAGRRLAVFVCAS
jgi:ubiquinone/menaquinone biosynthesis C-methylase UbiE